MQTIQVSDSLYQKIRDMGVGEETPSKTIERIIKNRTAAEQIADLDYMMSQKSSKTYSSESVKARYNLE